MKTTINEFKKILENFEGTAEYIIICNKNSCEARLTKESYEHGETDVVNYWDLSLNSKYDNVDKLIEDISSNFNIDFDKEDCIIMDDRLILEKHVDKDTSLLTTEEEELWKKGEFEAFSLYVDCKIELYITKPVTDSNKISEILNIKNYD